VKNAAGILIYVWLNDVTLCTMIQIWKRMHIFRSIVYVEPSNNNYDYKKFKIFGLDEMK